MQSISQLGVVSHADDLSLDDVVSMSDLDSLSHGVIHSVIQIQSSRQMFQPGRCRVNSWKQPISAQCLFTFYITLSVIHIFVGNIQSLLKVAVSRRVDRREIDCAFLLLSLTMAGVVKAFGPAKCVSANFPHTEHAVTE